MDRGVLNDTIGRVRQAYDATDPTTNFSYLTSGQQTAIVDLAYRVGTLGKKVPTISRASAEAIARAALDDRVAFIRKRYNEASPPTPFEKLPPGVQTAIADIAYQAPAIAIGAAPKLWQRGQI